MSDGLKVRKVLLLGYGGREHAIALALKKSDIELINWAPVVNPGIAKLCSHVIKHPYETNLEKDDLTIVRHVDLAIIGSEEPLVKGLTDWLESLHINVYGPNKNNAMIEGSKVYMRKLLCQYEIEGNVEFCVCNNADELNDSLEKSHQVAVKPDGLTGGKGVKVYGDHFKTKKLIFDYAYSIMQKDGVVLLEELVSGIEFSLQALVYGSKIIFLPLVKDYKRAYDDDVGPNTGSMGSCSFVDHQLPYLTKEQLEESKKILKDIVLALNEENGDFKGPIYGQFMITDKGLRLIEINARFGDPEAINVLQLLETPLLDVIDDLYTKPVEEIDIKFKDKATVCLYLVPKGYPEKPKSGKEITLENVDEMIFASVEYIGDKLVTTGSRSLAIIGFGDNLEAAFENAYAQIPKDAPSLRYRTDIGKEFLS